ncbi:MAG: NADPH:quinone oxidoreductase family protein [Pseudomonadales bacterium]
MKAIVCSEFGPVDTLSYMDVEAQPLTSGQALIQVHACGINFPDILLVQGKYQVRPELPFFPGGEVAGVVTEVAADVTTVKKGQRVMATIFWGGLAEQAVAPAKAVVPIPPNIDFITASVFQGGHTTSYYALKQRGQLHAGETLLVLGAAGGVGLAAVQLGKAMGARVIAAVSSEEKRACALRNGADESINYGREDLRERTKALTDGRGADVIFDPVGGDQFDQATRCVNSNGRILVVGFASGRIPQYAVNLALLKSCSIVGVNYQYFFAAERQQVEENFTELMRMVSEGKIKPHIDKVYPLKHAAEALQYVGDRKSIGKVVVSVPK